MNREELMDAVVEKCVSIRVGAFGTCRTHSVGWDPVDFKQGRCWRALELISFIEIAEPLFRQMIAKEIEDAAFHVFDDTDGYKGIMVHDHHEGLALAAEIARGGAVKTTS